MNHTYQSKQNFIKQKVKIENKIRYNSYHTKTVEYYFFYSLTYKYIKFLFTVKIS